MAKYLDKDPYLYHKEYTSFIQELRQFHANRGTPFFKIPTVNGREVDLYLLYTKVTSMGGWRKVNEEQTWEQIQRLFHLPSFCTNAEQALQNSYIRYLDLYERVHFLGEDPNAEAEQDEEQHFNTRTKRSFTPVASIPMVYKHKQHEISEHMRQSLGISTDFTETSDYDKLYKALLSGLPNEVDFAVNVILLMSQDSRRGIQISKLGPLVDLLMALVGIFGEGPESLRPVYEGGWKPLHKKNYIRFWYDTVDDAEIKELITLDNTFLEIDKKYDDSKTVGQDVLNLHREVGIDDHEGLRIHQIITIIRNMSFSEENAKKLASNLLVFRFLMLCTYSKYSTLKQLSLDAFANIASQFVLEPIDLRSTQLIFRCICQSVGSQDKFHVVRGMEILGNLCHIMNNEDIIADNLDPIIYETIASYLTVQDIQLIVHTLEVLYELSELGHTTTNHISLVSNCIDLLVSLLTVEAQSYGSKALVGIKVVETPGYVPMMSPTPAPTITRPAQSLLQPRPAMMQQVRPVQQQPIKMPVRILPAGAPGMVDQQLENEPYACNWLRAHFEELFSSTIGKIDIYAEYLSVCSKIRKGALLGPDAFVQCIRVTFPRATVNRNEKDGDISFTGISKRSDPLPFPPRQVILGTQPRLGPPSSLAQALQQRLPIPHRPSQQGTLLSPSPQSTPPPRPPSPRPGTPNSQANLIKSLLANKVAQNMQNARKSPATSQGISGPQVVQQNASYTQHSNSNSPSQESQQHNISYQQQRTSPSPQMLLQQHNVAQSQQGVSPSTLVSGHYYNHQQIYQQPNQQQPGTIQTLVQHYTPQRHVPVQQFNPSLSNQQNSPQPMRSNIHSQPSMNVQYHHAANTNGPLPQIMFHHQQPSDFEQPKPVKKRRNSGKSPSKASPVSPRQPKSPRPTSPKPSSSYDSASFERAQDAVLHTESANEAKIERVLNHCAISVSSNIETGDTKDTVNEASKDMTPDALQEKDEKSTKENATDNDINTDLRNVDNDKEKINSDTVDDCNKHKLLNGDLSDTPNGHCDMTLCDLLSRNMKSKSSVIDLIEQKKDIVSKVLADKSITDSIAQINGISKHLGNGDYTINRVSLDDNITKEKFENKLDKDVITSEHYKLNNKSVDMDTESKMVVENGHDEDTTQTNRINTCDIDNVCSLSDKGEKQTFNTECPSDKLQTNIDVDTTEPKTNSNMATPKTSPNGVLESKSEHLDIRLSVSEDRKSPASSSCPPSPASSTTSLSHSGTTNTSHQPCVPTNTSQSCGKLNSKRQSTDIVKTPKPRKRSRSRASSTGSTDSRVSSVSTPVPVGPEYMCEWAGCKRGFDNAKQVYLHAAKSHRPADGVCMWENCERMTRKLWALVSHMQDRHCSENALRAAFMRRQQVAQMCGHTPPPLVQAPLPPSYPDDAAIQAIRRFAPKAPYPEFTDSKEGPVTKHIRLTSALILRNIARYSPIGRSCLIHYEDKLSQAAMSNVEASRAISNCLWEMHVLHTPDSPV